MACSKWFANWFDSPYYHLLYQHRNDDEAITFITNLINYLNPQKDSKILDVACGKGRHSKALAEMGFDVTGIDLAKNSIIEAQKFSQNNLRFFVHDMRRPFAINYYDYVFNFFTSFGYFNTDREHINSIKNLSNALVKNGVLMIDFLNVNLINNADVNDKKVIGNIIFEIKKNSTSTHIYKEIKVYNDGELVCQHKEQVAKFELQHFETFFAKAGLQLQQVFGNYYLNKFDANTSPRLIMIVKKA